jgi:hypothetical protein
VSDNFIPVKVHVKEQPQVFKRFKGQWTPTQLVLDPDGTERYRIEGFLPIDDFLAQLEFGLARRAFDHEQYEEAEKHFRSVYESHADAGAAPEAAYWAGVSRYKRTNDPAALAETARRLHEKYPATEWARRSSVWLADASHAGRT